MSSPALRWRDNLRTNLVLWPDVAPNIAALATADGLVYDEDELLERFPRREGKSPTDSRAVRNTFEVFAITGLGYRSDDGRFLLTPMGRCVFRYFGVVGDRKIANPRNLYLLARHLVRGLAVVAEYRAIWALMRQIGNYLSNEELNRAIPHLRTLADVPEAACRIWDFRNQDPDPEGHRDPAVIGPRFYKDEEYGTDKETDQRKVMNVHFRLAGAGGLLISGDEDRRLAPWAVPLIDYQLAGSPKLIHATTSSESALYISDMAQVPYDALVHL